MGVAFSDEDGQEDDTPKCDVRYLHWLLSDENQVQDAFETVWGGCSPEDGNVARKAKVFEVLLKVISEFDRHNTMDDARNGGAPIGKMARQLGHIVEPLPEQLTRAEALHVFRTALLSLQTALVVKPGASLQYLQSSEEVDARGDSLGINPDELMKKKRTMEAVRLNILRKTTKGEDISTRALCPKLPPPVRQVLPSRQELEIESEQMRALSEKLSESNREELNVIRLLEDEFRANRAPTQPSGGLPATDAKPKLVLEREISFLEADLFAHNNELRSLEDEVGTQQREINSLLAERSKEEMAADEATREARDLASELKTCKRTCGGLESEIASEEVRATALREAFEGRRARFATAETAARNAELSTMRATRRRVAAESAVQREAEAVEEARSERFMAAASSRAKVHDLECELARVRECAVRAQSSLRIGGGLQNQHSDMRVTEAELELQATRNELAQVLRDRDNEIAIEHAAANETAQLELVRARIEEQLSARRSELQASRTSQPDERELARTAETIRQVEEKVAQMQRREAFVQQELLEAQAESQGSSGFWQHARDVAGELGDAQAALVRRRAQEQSTGSDGVVVLLRAALQDAEEKEARTAAELQELQNHRLRRDRPERSDRGGSAASRERDEVIDPNSPLGDILKQIESVRYQADSQQGRDNSGGSMTLRKEVHSLEQELDHKEEVILKLERLSCQLASALDR